MSLTNPRSSSTLSMLCCAPTRTFPACSSHCACLAAGSASSSAHLDVGRSPRASVDCRRMHVRHTKSRGRDSRLKADMAANCTALNLGPRAKCPGLPRWSQHDADWPEPLQLPRPPPHQHPHPHSSTSHALLAVHVHGAASRAFVYTVTYLASAIRQQSHINSSFCLRLLPLCPPLRVLLL